MGTDSDCGPSENYVHGYVITHHYNKAELMFDRSPFIYINIYVNEIYIHIKHPPRHNEYFTLHCPKQAHCTSKCASATPNLREQIYIVT